MRGDDIAGRLLDLAIACLQIASQIELTPAGKHMARQLIRCSTSVGASYEEARSAESRADFIHKIGIAAKEARETGWWLRIVERARLTPHGDIPRWLDEANQLLAVLIASARTARRRAGQRVGERPRTEAVTRPD